MPSDARKDPESIQRVLIVAISVCLVCSLFVSGSVVLLRPTQAINKNLDTQRNILIAAGLYEPTMNVARTFDDRVQVKLVDLRSGRFVDPDRAGVADLVAYDQRAATKDEKLSAPIPPDEDIAGIKRKAYYAKVYLIKDPGTSQQKIVLPISGYGLWSTLYGYIVLADDLDTVVGITFTDHGETPGLGGEVDNPKWKAQWPGKQIYDADGNVVAGLKKGGSNPDSEFDRRHLVDGLAGATLTSNGVNRLIRYWLGEHGFGPFLRNLKESKA